MHTEAQRSSVTLFSLEAKDLLRFMPHRYPMALLDRVEAFWPDDNRVIAIKHVSLGEPLLQDHYRGRPIFPAPLIIEALAQASGLVMNLNHLRRKQGIHLAQLMEPAGQSTRVYVPMSVLAESKVRQRRLVFPGSVLRLESHQVLSREQVCFFKVHASVEGEEVANGELLLAYPPYGPPSTVGQAGDGA